MRVRAFTALALAAIPVALACSDADTVGNPGGLGTGGGAIVSAIGGTTNGAIGGATLGSGGGGDAVTASGGDTMISTGGTGSALVATGGTTQNTGGTVDTTQNTGGTVDTTQNTGGTVDTTQNTGGTVDTTQNTGGTVDTGSTSGGEYTVAEGAFVTVCGWSGYAWTDADAASAIDPASFDGAAAGGDLCASGTVAAASDWSGYAMLAVNIGQASDAEESVNIASDGSGIYVDLDNNAGSTLRVQIQDSAATETSRWCATYTAPGVIPWSEFNTQCWEGGAGTAYNGEAINAVLVLVPSDDDTSTDFDFCINKVEPEGSPSCDGGSTGNTGGSTGNTGGTTGSTGGTTGNTGGTSSATECTDTLNPDDTSVSCQQWKDWDNCSQSWMIDDHICDATCGRCEGGSTNTGGSTGNTGGNSSTGGTTGGTTLPSVDTLSNVQNGWVSRYWDCCKPHCGWSGNGAAIPTCDMSDSSQGVNDQASSCDLNPGPSYMCHNFAPWSAGDQTAYGFVAYNSGNCGDCFLVEFTGSGHNGVDSSNLSGKRMIVQKVNIGGIASDQMDLLTPGGGVGDFNACTTQWGASDVGAQYGGFPTTCGADANCIRSKCESAFGNSPELMAGCNWYIDWLGMADNPNMRFAPIACPAEIRNVSGIG